MTTLDSKVRPAVQARTGLARDPRERLAALFDPGTLELLAADGDERGGVVAGVGLVHGAGQKLQRAGIEEGREPLPRIARQRRRPRFRRPRFRRPRWLRCWLRRNGHGRTRIQSGHRSSFQADEGRPRR